MQRDLVIDINKKRNNQCKQQCHEVFPAVAAKYGQG